VNVYPSAVEEILRSCDGVAEYRVEIHTGHPLPELHILVEPDSGCSDVAGLEKRLQSALRTALGLRIAVTHVPGGELPRFEMKAKRWVRVA
jgi:phenylacetate-CoA ligase